MQAISPQLLNSAVAAKQAVSLQPTQASRHDREQQAAPKKWSAGSRAYRAKIEICTDEFSVVFPEVPVALYDFQQIGRSNLV